MLNAINGSGKAPLSSPAVHLGVQEQCNLTVLDATRTRLNSRRLDAGNLRFRATLTFAAAPAGHVNDTMYVSPNRTDLPKLVLALSMGSYFWSSYRGGPRGQRWRQRQISPNVTTKSWVHAGHRPDCHLSCQCPQPRGNSPSTWDLPPPF